MQTLLTVDGLSLSFGGLAAIGGVSLQVPCGGITALVGPGGAGKSVLIGMLSGFLAPAAGRIAFDARDITGLAPDIICRMGLARTFHAAQPGAGQTVRSSIAVGARLHIRGRHAALAQADEVARRVGLGAQVDKPVSWLGTSARRRLELARALATRPRLLVLDGLLGGLAPADAAQLHAVLRGLAEDGITLLLAERLPQDVVALAGSVSVLCAGRVIAEGPPAQVRHFPHVIDAYRGFGAAPEPGARGAHPPPVHG